MERLREESIACGEQESAPDTLRTLLSKIPADVSRPTALSALSLFPLKSPSDLVLFPGFCDVHVHFREPGFSYKEEIYTGSLAAAHGGYTAVCTMPNLDPVPDSLPHLRPQLSLIEKNARVRVFPYGAITGGEKGESLSDMEALAPYVIAFSDDGRGVQSEELMLSAMKKAKALGKMIVAHCEVNSLLRGGYIHDGQYAAAHGHRGICSESEWRQIERDLRLAAKTGCAYHVCHVSTKEGVALLREAKKAGLDVSFETAPHYLLLDERDLREDGRFKMNPPLRSPADREALLEAAADGTLDMIATDHAPHSAAEKARGLAGSPFGIVGLETAFPTLYTGLVKKGILSLDRLTALLSTAPARRFGISARGDLSLWDLSEHYKIDPTEFFSKGKATPFEGTAVFGRCLAVRAGGKWGYLDEKRLSAKMEAEGKPEATEAKGSL